MAQALRTLSLALAPLSLALAALCVLGVVAAWWIPLPERLSSAPSRSRHVGGRTVATSLSADHKWRLPVSLEHVDADYVRAVIDLEDRRFRRHPGLDPVALARAALRNLRRGRVVQGGSTLSMQLAGLLEPRARSVRGKLVEALRALQLEIVLGKDGVLAAYLELCPFGRNIEGVEAASLAYFGHGAARLSAAEIATLLAVAQAPRWRYPTRENHGRLRAARDAIVLRLIEDGALPPAIEGVRFPPGAVVEHARATPVPVLSLQRLTGGGLTSRDRESSRRRSARPGPRRSLGPGGV